MTTDDSLTAYLFVFETSTTGTIGDIGSIIAGLSAFGTLVVAVWVASRTIPNELRRWKQQRLAEEKNKAGAQALISIHRLVQAMHLVTSPLSLSNRQSPNQFAEYQGKWAAIADDIEAFNKARTTARVYLSEEVEEIFRKLWEHATAVRVNAELFFMSTIEDIREERINLNKSFGKHAMRPFLQLEEEAQTILHPVIRLEE